MSDRTFYLILGGWTLSVVVMMVLLYREAKKSDEKLEAALIEEDFVAEETEAEQRERFARDAAVPVVGEAWLDRARKAEALGFRDEIEPKRIA